MNMNVNIAGVKWKNPVTVASGTFGSGEEFSEFVDLNKLGAITTKGVADVPWARNPTPRVAEVYGGMMNAIGLQNPGIDLFCERDIPYLQKYDTKIIVNVCGHAPEEYFRVVERLADEPIDMMEINISCPNVNAGFLAFGQDAKNVEKLTADIKKIAKQPIIMKLTPNVTDITEIAKAAEELSISQPSLSHAVSSLEKEIGIKLFEKQGRGVVLTKYGKIFKEYVDEAIHSLDTGVKKVQSMTGQTEGVVELAYIYTLGSGFVPRLVGDFLRTHEELKVKFRFTVGNTSEIIQGLKEDRFDIGFCSMAEREGEIGFTPVGREKLVVVVPKGHPLSYERAVDLEQAAAYPQIFYTPNSGLRPVVDRMFEQAKLNPKIAYEIEEDGSMAGLVAENFGIAIMPEIPILSQLDVDVVPLRNQDQQRYIYMAQGKEKYHPPLVQKFAEYVKRREM